MNNPIRESPHLFYLCMNLYRGGNYTVGDQLHWDYQWDSQHGPVTHISVDDYNKAKENNK